MINKKKKADKHCIACTNCVNTRKYEKIKMDLKELCINLILYHDIKIECGDLPLNLLKILLNIKELKKLKKQKDQIDKKVFYLNLQYNHYNERFMYYSEGEKIEDRKKIKHFFKQKCSLMMEIKKNRLYLKKISINIKKIKIDIPSSYLVKN